MTNKELRIILNKLPISKRELSKLLGYDSTYLSTLSSREQQDKTNIIPTHIETIINLICYLKTKNIDFIDVLKSFKNDSQKTNLNKT